MTDYEHKVTTNNKPRPVIDAWLLTAKEREDFDYLDWEAIEDGRDSASFFRYRKELYDLGNFLAWDTAWTGPRPEWAGRWDGFYNDSFFTGMVVRYASPDCEQVVVGSVIYRPKEET
jgi:hypothetical protein